MSNSVNPGATRPVDNRIIPFPLWRRQSIIRRCAVELDRKSGKEATDYWCGECRRLADELLAQGFAEAEVRHQVLEFQDEVQFELMRLHESQSAFS